VKNQEPERVFQAKSKVKHTWLALVFAGAALFAASLAAERPVAGGPTLLVVAIVMALWFRKAKLVRLHADHCELKFAPLSPLRKILYRDIRKVEPLSKQRVRLTYFAGAREKSVKIPLNVLDEAEGRELLQFLSSRAA
jgi:hypothetical protein